MKNYPTTHWGWHEYYVDRFNKLGLIDSCHLAMWYLLLCLRDGEVPT